MDTIAVMPARTGSDDTCYQCWYPVCLGSDIGSETLPEDEPILESMRFRRGTLVASDRHLARYFRYVSEFPRAAPPDC
jgi:hypothetical protein